MIDIPYVGQSVYYVREGDKDRYAATIAWINRDGTVNLGWLAAGGNWQAARDVEFVRDGAGRSGPYAASWPVYSGEPAPPDPVREALPADHP